MAKNNKKAKSKYKFTAMDYITIGFTAVIVVIMVVFLLKALKPEWFEKKNKSDTPPAATQQNTDPQATKNTPVDQPTEAPFYSGIGNTYGNMSNNAAAAEIDGRLYYVDTEESGKAALKVDDGERTRVIVGGEAAISCVNVIKDPFTYADVAGSVAYKVMFLDGSGNICAVTDGPFPSGDDSDISEGDATVTEKKTMNPAGKGKDAENQYQILERWTETEEGGGNKLKYLCYRLRCFTPGFLLVVHIRHFFRFVIHYTCRLLHQCISHLFLIVEINACQWVGIVIRVVVFV